MTAWMAPTPSQGEAVDYSSRGYLEEEFFLSGVATSYDGTVTEDGAWDATPGATAPFTTRFIVRRPLDASRFNGTVVVEWNNVSGGSDASPDWSTPGGQSCSEWRSTTSSWNTR